MSKLVEKLEAVLEELKEAKKTRKLNAQEKRTESRLIYHLRAEGVHSVSSNKKSSGFNSQLAKKYSQQTREAALFSGGLQASKEANKEAKEDPKALEEQLQQEQIETEILEAEEVEEIVLANSEEKPKKRGRKKKTED